MLDYVKVQRIICSFQRFAFRMIKINSFSDIPQAVKFSKSFSNLKISCYKNRLVHHCISPKALIIQYGSHGPSVMFMPVCNMVKENILKV